MNAPLPTPPAAPRPRWGRRGLLILALAATAWVGWREYDHRAAIREARAAGFTWTSAGPVERIRADWRTAFHLRTWTRPERSLELSSPCDLSGLRPLLLRLRPTYIDAQQCRSPDLEALRGLTSLTYLEISHSPGLLNASALRDVPGLNILSLFDCTNLQSLDGLDALHHLTYLNLIGCTKIPAEAITALRAAHPDAEIDYEVTEVMVEDPEPRQRGHRRQ